VRVSSLHPRLRQTLVSGSVSALGAAADAARSKQEMLAVLAKRNRATSPSRKSWPPPVSAAPRPTTPYQVAKALVEETKRQLGTPTSVPIHWRTSSLATSKSGRRRAKKPTPSTQWEVMYAAYFIDALNQGWRFKDVEDAIDAAETTKHRFVCCTPRRLLENGESVMKLVYALRRKGETLRQKLGEQ